MLFSSCERTSTRCGSKQMAMYQAVAQTQSSCLITARERPRAGIKQMATYQAVAQTQSSGSSSNLCCPVATQTWSAHVARPLLHIHSVDPKLRCFYCCCTYFLAHAAAACLLHFSLSHYFSPTFVFFPPQTALLLLLYIFSRTRSSSMLAALLSLPLCFRPLFLFH